MLGVHVCTHDTLPSTENIAGPHALLCHQPSRARSARKTRLSADFGIWPWPTTRDCGVQRGAPTIAQPPVVRQLSTFYSFFDSFRGLRACLVCLLAKVAQIGHQRCMWCQPILRAPTFAWHAPRVGPVRTKPAPGSGPTFHPESRGDHKKKLGRHFFRAPPPFQLSLPGLIPAGGAEIFLAPNPALQK